jgi:multiple sugar transport system permease protein
VAESSAAIGPTHARQAVRPGPKRIRGWGWLPYVIVVPILGYEGVFVIYPIVKGIRTSFQSEQLGSHGGFSFANYTRMFHDPIFWEVLRTTLEFCAVVVVLVLLVGLAIGLLLNWSFRGRPLVRGVLAIPWAVPDIPTILTFILMMDPNFGIINRMAGWLPGIGNHHAWLTNPNLAFVSILMITVWKGFPFYALIILSALQSVSDDLLEAAKMDGAGVFRRFRSVILPEISPTLALLAVLAYVYSMQQFSLIYLSTGGGPGNTTTTLSVQIYDEAFQFFSYSYASAIAVVGLVLSVFGTVLFVLIGRRMARRQ